MDEPSQSDHMDEGQGDLSGTGEPASGASGEGESAAPDAPPPLPPLHTRIIDVFFNPGRLTKQLAANPAWAGALLVLVFLVALQTGLIPFEVMQEAQREAMLERGEEMPELPESFVRIMRIVTPVFSGIAIALMSFIFAGVYTLIFAFILGDEGKYRQYLSIMVHAWLISTVIGLFLTPLRIASGDPQFTISLGSFAFFLPDGSYSLAALRMMDLTQIWAGLVIAQGATAIDSRRSFVSAATVTVGLTVLIALIVAIWVR